MDPGMIVERAIHGQKVQAECAETNSRMAANVLDVFQRLADLGKRIEPGIQVRFGWSLLRLVEDGGALRVAEPDFARWPEPHWIPTIDTTLNVLAAQTGLLHKIEVEGEDAFFDQVIISAPKAIDRPKVFLRRTASSSAEDSGWLLGPTEDPEALSGDCLEPVLISSLVARRSVLLQSIALPPGFIALFFRDSLVQIFDASGRVRFPFATEENKKPAGSVFPAA
jgi:hypothetical protein